MPKIGDLCIVPRRTTQLDLIKGWNTQVLSVLAESYKVQYEKLRMLCHVIHKFIEINEPRTCPVQFQLWKAYYERLQHITKHCRSEYLNEARKKRVDARLNMPTPVILCEEDS